MEICLSFIDCSIRVIMQDEIEKRLKGHNKMALWQRYTIQSRFPLLSVKI